MLSWDLPLRGCVCAEGLMLRKQITNRVNGADKPKKVSKRATIMQALGRGVSVKPLQATARRRAAVCGA